MGLDVSTTVLGFVIFLPPLSVAPQGATAPSVRTSALSDSSHVSVSDLLFVVPSWEEHVMRLQRKREIQLPRNLYSIYIFFELFLCIQMTQYHILFTDSNSFVQRYKKCVGDEEMEVLENQVVFADPPCSSIIFLELMVFTCLILLNVGIRYELI